MDYIEAVFQRRELEVALANTPGSESSFELQPCTEELPCMDGRCPCCCSHLATAIAAVTTMSNRAWYYASFVLDENISPVGSSEKIDLVSVKTWLDLLSVELRLRDSVFIGTYGLLVNSGAHCVSKCIAVDILYSVLVSTQN